MDEYTKLLAYWQDGSATLANFYGISSNEKIAISEFECRQGKINHSLIHSIFAKITSPSNPDYIDVIIVPIVLKKDQVNSFSTIQELHVLCLQAKISRDGEILPNKAQPLPWISRILTEPTATFPFSFGNNENFDRYYLFNPPIWSNNELQTWQQQLAYAEKFFNENSCANWQDFLKQYGYYLANGATIIPTSFLNNALPSFNKIVKRSQLWQKLLATSTDELKYSECIKLPDKKSFLHLAHTTNKYSLANQQREVLTQALSLEPNKILYIKAGPGTGKTTVINDLIASLWIQAIIEDKLPSSIAYVDNDQALHRLSILDCWPEGSTWLSKIQRQSLYNNEQSTEPKSKIIENFLIQCSNEFHKTITNLEEAKVILRERITLLNTALTQGIEAACSYHDLSKKIDFSYRSYGGIEQRNKAIKESTDKQYSYCHYLEVLQSLWQRQITPESKWQQWLEFLPPIKRSKTEKLRAFFAKHLPDEEVDNLNIVEMHEHLQSLLLRAEKKKHALADILKQVESDLQQLGFAEARLRRWVPEHIGEEFDLAKLFKSLDTHLRYRLFLTSLHFWEAELLQKAGWEHNDLFIENYLDPRGSITNLVQHPIDWIIVERSECLSPITGFYCLEGCKRIIVFANDDTTTTDRIPMEIDVNLLKMHKLVETDEDIEDLQLKGLLVSNGKFNTLIEQIADYKGEHLCLNKQWDVSYKIIECYNQLLPNNKLQACSKNKNKFIADFAYLPLDGYKESFLGSYINDAEITAIINWIKQNEAALLSLYPEYAFNDIILLCTPFYGQYVALKETLQTHNLDVNVELIQTPTTKRVPIIIFSPVYTKKDKGLLNFDHGEQMLKNLLLKVKDHLLVFGDCQIFDQNLHSASGKLAKFLLETKKNELLVCE